MTKLERLKEKYNKKIVDNKINLINLIDKAEYSRAAILQERHKQFLYFENDLKNL